jgi:tripartite-type tricarboxylate transporter receptor subunit TctC
MEVMMMKKNLIIALSVIFILGMVQLTLAADYPAKPISIVVPMAPGGARDLGCRAFASVAEKLLGKTVVVVNKPGASGMIGMLAAAKAAPDGYTLTGSSSSDVGAVEWEIVNGRKPLYSFKDFIPLGTITMSPTLIAVPYDSPWKTFADLLKDAKTKPGHYKYVSGGMYNATHLSAELVIEATDLKIRHVPYAGSGASVAALVGNHGDLGFVSKSSSLNLVRGNKLRILAVQGDQRLDRIPDVPTLKELGIANADYVTWQGILAPVKTPKSIVVKLREVFKKVVENEDFIKIIKGQGEDIAYISGEELVKFIEDDSIMHAKLLKRLLEEEKGKK